MITTCSELGDAVGAAVEVFGAVPGAWSTACFLVTKHPAPCVGIEQTAQVLGMHGDAAGVVAKAGAEFGCEAVGYAVDSASTALDGMVSEWSQQLQTVETDLVCTLSGPDACLWVVGF